MKNTLPLTDLKKALTFGFALEPEGFRICEGCERVPEMMTKKPQADIGNEEVFKNWKINMCAIDLNAGQELRLNNLTSKIYLISSYLSVNVIKLLAKK